MCKILTLTLFSRVQLFDEAHTLRTVMGLPACVVEVKAVD